MKFFFWFFISKTGDVWWSEVNFNDCYQCDQLFTCSIFDSHNPPVHSRDFSIRLFWWRSYNSMKIENSLIYILTIFVHLILCIQKTYPAFFDFIFSISSLLNLCAILITYAPIIVNDFAIIIVWYNFAVVICKTSDVLFVFLFVLLITY